jgi:hypothetical protein
VVVMLWVHPNWRRSTARPSNRSPRFGMAPMQACWVPWSWDKQRRAAACCGTEDCNLKCWLAATEAGRDGAGT